MTRTRLKNEIQHKRARLVSFLALCSQKVWLHDFQKDLHLDIPLAP